MTARELAQLIDAEEDAVAKAAWAAARLLCEWVDCPRCGGKGYAHFIGTSRPPGPCFRCGASGKVPGKGGQAYRATTSRIELDRLRRIWKRYRDEALPLAKEAQAQAIASGVRRATFYARMDLEDVERQMKAIEAAGRDLAAKVGSKGKRAGGKRRHTSA
jgi:hypothetical protein